MRKILPIILLILVGILVGNYPAVKDYAPSKNIKPYKKSIGISIDEFNLLKDTLGLDDSCIYVPYKGNDIKALFYEVNTTQDTFYYQVNKDNTITRIAIVYKGGGISAREENITINKK